MLPALLYIRKSAEAQLRTLNAKSAQVQLRTFSVLMHPTQLQLLGLSNKLTNFFEDLKNRIKFVC